MVKRRLIYTITKLPKYAMAEGYIEYIMTISAKVTLKKMGKYSYLIRYKK